MTRVSDLSEDALLALIVPHLPVSDDAIVPTGDDCAVLAASDGRVAVSTDMLVEGRHFLRTWSTGADVGWRAAMQNLADAVAMGARPTSLVVSMDGSKILPAQAPKHVDPPEPALTEETSWEAIPSSSRLPSWECSTGGNHDCEAPR